MVAEDRTIRIRGGIAHLWDTTAREVLVQGPAGTGKSFGILTRIFQLCEDHPNIRVLICRQSRASLTESILVTWESKVLPEGDRMIVNGPTRAHRQSYEFANGSTVVCCGLDKPERTYSSEYDLIYCAEATEITEDAYEQLFRALRNNRLPFQQIISDCNPAHPRHWLNQRALAGKMVRIISRHTDNPAVTREYLDTLASLTGVRRTRLYLGQWASAEGLVFEGWDESIHVVNERSINPKWYAVGVDWGFTAPGTMQVWGVDGDGRRHLEAEYYHTRRRLADWIVWAREVYDEYHPRFFACDPAEPGFVEEFQRAGLPAIAANNDRHAGFDAVRKALVVQSDGHPRLTVGRYTLRHAKDAALDAVKKPCCLSDEVPAYVYQDTSRATRNEEPDPRCADHACDACRYANIEIDSMCGGGGVGVMAITPRTRVVVDNEWEDDRGWDHYEQ